MTDRATDDVARDWDVVARWRAFDGESRANVLRAIGVLLFYCVELLNRYGLHLGGLDLAPAPGVTAKLHGAITALAVTWAACAAGVVVLLRNRIFPRALAYATTAIDVVLLTAVLSIADGPKSPLVVVYFPVLALTMLRGSPRLVACGATLVVGGYLTLVAESIWVRHALRVPFYHSALFTLSAVLVGVVLARATAVQRADATELADRRAHPSVPPEARTEPAAPAKPAEAEGGE